MVPDAPPPEDSEPLEANPPPPPARVAPSVVPRWVQLILLPLAALAVWSLARAAGTALLIFLIATVIALILNPLVKFLQRGRLPRGLAVAAVYIGLLVVLVGVGVLLVTPATNQVEAFQKDVPNLTGSANRSLADLQDWLDSNGVNFRIKKQGETALQTLQHSVVKRSGAIVSFTQDLVQNLVEAAFALILILVISIYMLLYGDEIGKVVRSVMPPGDGSPDDDYPVRAQKAVSGYVRGQLLFSAIMGLSASAGLWILGVTGVFPDGERYALFFGAFYGLMELIPYVGPVLGALPPILVALFNDPLTAVWVALLFLSLQQLEGHVVAPQVFGHSLRINPLLIIFSLLIGAELYGIVGALIALPLAAVARETVVYLRRHLVLEPWGTMGPEAVVAGAPPPHVLLAGTRCPQCGAEVWGEDAHCRSCGAALAPAVPAPG